MDLLSDVLRDLRLESAVLSMGEFRAPWGFEKGAIEAAPFHVVVEGHCLLEVEGGPAIELTAGDLVVMPQGNRHALLSEQSAPRSAFKQVLEANGIGGSWAPVGSSVMDYVTSMRMHLAADMVAGSRKTLPKIASEVGYESEISFSKAFRRWAGVPPGQYRRRMKSSGVS